jgi:hypothetical protein
MLFVCMSWGYTAVCLHAPLQVGTFEGSDVWLRIMAAEKAGLIKVNLEFKRDKVTVRE